MNIVDIERNVRLDFNGQVEEFRGGSGVHIVERLLWLERQLLALAQLSFLHKPLFLLIVGIPFNRNGHACSSFLLPFLYIVKKAQAMRTGCGCRHEGT